MSTVRDVREMAVVLVPSNGLDPQTGDGNTPEPRVPLAIKEISIGIDQAMPEPPREEQEELRRQEAVG